MGSSSESVEAGCCWDRCVRLMCKCQCPNSQTAVNPSAVQSRNIQQRCSRINAPLSQPSSRCNHHHQHHTNNHHHHQRTTATTNGHVGKHHHNGHAFTNGVARQSNGVCGRPEEKLSTISRYLTIERPRQPITYQVLKRLCREKGELFEDPEFPANSKSLFSNKKLPMQPIIWMRPHEICQRPRFIADNLIDENGEERKFEAECGDLGDPSFLAALSSLILTPRFLKRVVPPDQNFDPAGSYCGIFRFRFWHFGEWKEILVDDRLPTYKGRLIFSRPTNSTEFWAALLEKAYAKFYGTYENLSQGGCTTRALQDLTGGIVQSFGLSNQDRYLTYQVLNSAVPRSSLLIASINLRDSKRQLRLRNGLMTQHAYSVTGLARVRGPLGETPLVRLRNPWGQGEWTGPWSERSWEWDGLSHRDKELLSVRVRNDGEFWMSFEDFAKHFTQLDIVHISPDDWMTEPSLHSKQPWRAVLARRRWRTGYNAGGGPTYTDTTAVNPQFHVAIPRSSNNKCHVVVSVTQHYETQPEEKLNKQLYAIGFAVYEIPHNMARLTPKFVSDQKPLDVTNHSIAREVVTFFTLPPGDYIVVPQTSIPNCDTKFLLRILTDEQSNIWEVNEDNMLFRNIPGELLDDALLMPDQKPLFSRLSSKYPLEVDVVQLQKILRNYWKVCLLTRPSLELCKTLIMLRDINISGKINLREIPVLMHMLQFWRIAFQKFEKGSHCAKTSSYNLRPLLWEAGSTVSNKVLECLVLRFTKNTILTAECFVMAMVRLHLAHERYHNLDTKMKTNPLSLEELILMTIYS